jgi:hypothetical protein
MRRADGLADLRTRVFARDGHRCALAPWARHHVEDPAAPEVDDDDLDAPSSLHEFTVPPCWGRLGIGHRRPLETGGADAPTNCTTLCAAHRRWIEDEPDLARELGGETPWWLVVLPEDTEWARLSAPALPRAS